MIQNLIIDKSIKLESGLYTVQVKEIVPKYGSNLLNLALKIKAVPETETSNDCVGEIFYATVDSNDKTFQEVFRVYSWKKRSTSLEDLTGIYIDCWVEPKIENGDVITSLSNFGYSFDLNESETDRTEDEQ